MRLLHEENWTHGDNVSSSWAESVLVKQQSALLSCTPNHPLTFNPGDDLTPLSDPHLEVFLISIKVTLQRSKHWTVPSSVTVSLSIECYSGVKAQEAVRVEALHPRALRTWSAAERFFTHETSFFDFQWRCRNRAETHFTPRCCIPSVSRVTPYFSLRKTKFVDREKCEVAAAALDTCMNMIEFTSYLFQLLFPNSVNLTF